MTSHAAIQTTTAAQQLARELFEKFRAQSQEAEQLALQMIGAGEARLRLSMILAGDVPSFDLLLEPTHDEGEPVEIASTRPVQPSAEAVASRIWFFGRLSHWQVRH